MGTFLVVQWLRLCLPMQRVWILSLVGEVRSHIPRGQKTKTWNSIVKNSIKTLKMARIKKKKTLKINKYSLISSYWSEVTNLCKAAPAHPQSSFVLPWVLFSFPAEQQTEETENLEGNVGSLNRKTINKHQNPLFPSERASRLTRSQMQTQSYLRAPKTPSSAASTQQSTVQAAHALQARLWGGPQHRDLF